MQDVNLKFCGPWANPVDVTVKVGTEKITIGGNERTGVKIVCGGFMVTTSGEGPISCTDRIFTTPLPAEFKPNYGADFVLFGRYDGEVDFKVKIDKDGIINVDATQFANRYRSEIEIGLHPFQLQYILIV